MPRSCAPLLVARQMLPLEECLLDLLRALRPAEWEMQTIVPGWRVLEVVAHLLDTQLRKLAIVRDGHAVEVPSIQCSADLVEFVNRLNREGVQYLRRLSPSLLIAMMEVASRESCAFHESLDPYAPTKFAVSWAGETESQNWFDTARELTERWHHQQQIRLATSRPGIEIPGFYHPVLDCFLRGLPHTYRAIAAPEGMRVRIDITGESGGTWNLFRLPHGWMLTPDDAGEQATRVTIPGTLAWRLFTKGISQQEAREAVKIEGEERLGVPIFGHLAIVG